MYDEEIDRVVKVLKDLTAMNADLLILIKSLQDRVSNLEEKMNDR